MKTVWKFPLGPKVVTDEVLEVEMPKDAHILHCATQDEVICLWVLVESENDIETRRFYILGTGDYLDGSKREKYIGTVLQYGGKYVWHVWELLEEDKAKMPPCTLYPKMPCDVNCGDVRRCLGRLLAVYWTGNVRWYKQP